MAKKKDQPKTDADTDTAADTAQTPTVMTPDTAAPSDTQPINKSESIRRLFEEMGMDTPADKVRSVLAEKGIEVSTAAIYQTKARMQGGKKKRASNGGGDDNDYEELLTVKEFAKEVGGLERLKRLCDVLLRLQQD